MSGAAGGVRQPRKLSEVTENSAPRVVARRPAAVVTAFGVIGCGTRPVSSWLVSALCPFGCESRVHTFGVPLGYFPLWGETVYCIVADRFFCVIVPESLLDSARSLLVGP